MQENEIIVEEITADITEESGIENNEPIIEQSEVQTIDTQDNNIPDEPISNDIQSNTADELQVAETSNESSGSQEQQEEAQSAIDYTALQASLDSINDKLKDFDKTYAEAKKENEVYQNNVQSILVTTNIASFLIVGILLAILLSRYLKG